MTRGSKPNYSTFLVAPVRSADTHIAPESPTHGVASSLHTMQTSPGDKTHRGRQLSVVDPGKEVLHLGGDRVTIFLKREMPGI